MALTLHITETSAAGIPADPLDALDRMAGGAGGTSNDLVLLHSGGGEGVSVLGHDPLCRLVVDVNGRATLSGALAEAVDAPGAMPPLQTLEHVVKALSIRGTTPTRVGWLGFVSYDIGATLEKVPRVGKEDLAWPLLLFTLFRRHIVWDHASRTVRVFTLHTEHEAPADLPLPPPREAAADTSPPRIVERQTRDAYVEKVRRVQEYIAAGDIYQANLAQRWVVETSDTPLQVFRRLCAASPAPYAAFMRFADGTSTERHVLSASPELFLTLDKGHIVTRPIKGTRPRDLWDPARDAALREQLIASEKDRAELAMIVDLLRNDVGRVARFGSVHVIEPRAVERHPTVWHTVATVECDLREGVGLAEVLAAVCPGGSITGAPKIRAMQIIEELEGFRRGLYCGNIGVIAPGGGAMALNIAIRTILMQGGRAYVYAGGGVVTDSVPEKEFEETLHKARAMMGALRAGNWLIE
jgi:aminodeoxychorismate synthase component I